MKRGFTIVELLIVIVVIAILAAITVVAYNGIQNRAYDSSVQADLQSIAKKIQLFNVINDRFPKGSPDLDNADTKVTKSAYSRGMYNGTSYFNLVYCWPNAASPTQFALVAESKSGSVFQYATGRVTKVSYAFTTGSIQICASAGVTMDSGSDRDWFYNTDSWMSYAKG